MLADVDDELDELDPPLPPPGSPISPPPSPLPSRPLVFPAAGLVTAAAAAAQASLAAQVGAGFDITEEILEKIINQGEKELIIVNIDQINKGPYILESLKIDKNTNKTEALNDIYKVLRPGEAPSSEVAEEVFNNLYFKKERYDLSEVGRVKLNSKLKLENEHEIETILNSGIMKCGDPYL